MKPTKIILVLALVTLSGRMAADIPDAYGDMFELPEDMITKAKPTKTSYKADEEKAHESAPSKPLWAKDADDVEKYRICISLPSGRPEDYHKRDACFEQISTLQPYADKTNACMRLEDHEATSMCLRKINPCRRISDYKEKMDCGDKRREQSKADRKAWHKAMQNLRAKWYERCQSDLLKCTENYEKIRKEQEPYLRQSIRAQANQRYEYGLISKGEQSRVHFVENCIDAYYATGETMAKAVSRLSAHEMQKCAEEYNSGNLISESNKNKVLFKIER